MKLLLSILILCTLHATAQKSKFFSGNDIVTYALCGVGGYAEGTGEAVIAGKFSYDSHFWGMTSFENKYQYGWVRQKVFTFTCDGAHLCWIVAPTAYTAAIVIHIGSKENWKAKVAKGLICFGVSRTFHELGYKPLIK